MYPGTFATTTPDRPAVIMTDTGRTVTYGELEERSTRLANHLRDQGLGVGSVVAILASNAPEYLEAYWACLRSGMYAGGVNHNLSPDEIAYILDNSDAAALIISADLADLAVAALERVEGVDLRVVFGGTAAGFDDYESALAAASPLAPDDQPRGADMLYSSGTTGRPKGVKPELLGLQVDEPGVPLIDAFAPVFGFDPATIYLSPAPLYHAAPLRFCGLVIATGGTVLVMPRFDARASLEAIERYRATHSQWVPTMFVRMLKLPEETRTAYDLSSMRCTIHAAAPCPVEVKKAMHEWWDGEIWEYYGATEGNGLTVVAMEDWLAHEGTVGKAVLGTIRICDALGNELPPGEIGTVYVERDRVTFTYHKDPEKTRAGQHPEHETWSAVGDIGYLDEEGYLYLTDRQAFTIISGGVNIYPQEIEDCLTLHPKVSDVAVIGVPDEEMGQRVLAVVQAAPGHDPGEGLVEELATFVRSRLAGFKQPREWAFTDDMPRSATGKLVKRRLQDQFD
ncbi:acyl-CoA synthetase [Euzebya tangerina]|uniref:acyl-CoA synthetase n=1 Tax=Euzebya tangerina TaxID=591198 RepID=UPI000E324708|nr:acyl-CoA synthetase [Euzebya tangerina]